MDCEWHCGICKFWDCNYHEVALMRNEGVCKKPDDSDIMFRIEPVEGKMITKSHFYCEGYFPDNKLRTINVNQTLKIMKRIDSE